MAKNKKLKNTVNESKHDSLFLFFLTTPLRSRFFKASEYHCRTSFPLVIKKLQFLALINLFPLCKSARCFTTTFMAQLSQEAIKYGGVLPCSSSSLTSAPRLRSTRIIRSRSRRQAQCSALRFLLPR